MKYGTLCYLTYDGATLMIDKSVRDDVFRQVGKSEMVKMFMTLLPEKFEKRVGLKLLSLI